MKTKTVVLFVRHDEGEHRTEFVEACEVGKKKHFKTPSHFINEFKKLYRDASKGEHSFKITNIVIG